MGADDHLLPWVTRVSKTSPSLSQPWFALATDSLVSKLSSGSGLGLGETGEKFAETGGDSEPTASQSDVDIFTLSTSSLVHRLEVPASKIAALRTWYKSSLSLLRVPRQFFSSRSHASSSISATVQPFFLPSWVGDGDALVASRSANLAPLVTRLSNTSSSFFNFPWLALATMSLVSQLSKAGGG